MILFNLTGQVRFDFRLKKKISVLLDLFVELLYLRPKSCQLDDEFHGKEDCEHVIHDVEKVCVDLRLVIETHG